MREFFKGWRRKTGVVTLTIACFAMVFWLRGLSLYEELHIKTGGDQSHTFTSTSGAVIWHRWKGRVESDLWKVSSSAASIRLCGVWPSRLGSEISYGPDMSRVQSEGFYGPDRRAIGSGLVVPYWAIVLPLCFLSAWLMLSKQPSVKRPVEPMKDQP